MESIAPSDSSFDFTRYPKRRIAIMFLYLGWNFDGFVTQLDTANTVEEHIFSALMKTRLIENRNACNWTRCGRTDKGVSAFRQVASLIVRSSDTSRTDIFWDENECSCRVSSTHELPYLRMLNSVLPKTIRVLSYAPVNDGFNARNSCSSREYVYFLPRANFNLEKLNDGCSRLIGSHDFRNMCRIDNNESRLEMSYIRTIFSSSVQPIRDKSGDDEPNQFDILKLCIKASGFLWHQIRCIVALLCEVGVGNESPEIVSELLDVKKNPAKPQYNIANELPLCLFDCSYPDAELEWTFDPETLAGVLLLLQKHWAEHQMKASMIRTMIRGINSFAFTTNFDGLEEFVRSSKIPKKYIPIKKRPKCYSLEDRREKRKRLGD